MTISRARRRLVAALLCATLAAGCANMIPGRGAPPKLYSLSPKSTYSPDLPTVSWQLVVEVPVSAETLNTPRIALSRDPLVRKQARIDAIHGLIDLMDAAFESAPAISRPTLILYGRKDEIIPSRPTYEMLKTVPPNATVRVALYKSGYHMLLRGLDAATPLNDIAAWIIDRRAPLPSGADKEAEKLTAGEE